MKEIYEALKLEEEFLMEYAFPLDKAKQKASDLGNALVEHFALIGMLGKADDNYNHWVSEAANFCKLIDNIKVKKSGKLDSDYFIDEFLFHLDTDNDAEIDVNAAWVNHGMPSIINYNFTREDFRRYKEFRNECFKELAQLFSEKEDHTIRLPVTT